MSFWDDPIFHPVIVIAAILGVISVVWHVAVSARGHYFFFRRWQTTRYLGKFKVALEDYNRLRSNLPNLIGLAGLTVAQWVVVMGCMAIAVGIVAPHTQTSTPWNSLELVWDLFALIFVIMAWGAAFAAQRGTLVLWILAMGMEKEKERTDIRGVSPRIASLFSQHISMSDLIRPFD